MFWKRFTQARSAGKLFNQANENWRRRQRFVLASDYEGARQACIEVIRLCQLSIQGDERMGDAYVLLANALSVAASRILRQTNLDQYKFLHSRAAAVFHLWYTLPHRGYPITKNTATEIGERLWKITLSEIMEDEGLSESQAIALMDSYRDSLAADTVSPSSFEEIEKVIFNQSLVSEAEILEEICQLLNTPLPDIFTNLAAQRPIIVSTIERILRKLLQEDYDMYWKMAEARVRSKKQA